MLRRSFWCLLALSLLSGPAAAGSSFRLQQSGDQLFLLHGGARVLLWDRYAQNHQKDVGPAEVALSGGVTVSLGPRDTITVRRGATELGRVDYSQTMKEWLRRESLWGGHKQANDLTYQLRGVTTGGSTAISDLTPAGSSVLAIASWRTGGSGLPIVAQFLVRLRVTPTPVLEPLRRLSLIEEHLYQPPHPRLFRSSETIFLFADPGKVEQIDAAGKTVRVAATFPSSHEPQGLVKGRWLVLTEQAPGVRQPISLFDLTSRRARALPGSWSTLPSGASGPLMYVPASGTQVLVRRTVRAKQDTREVVSLVRIPSGKATVLRDAAFDNAQIWKGYLLARSGEGKSLNVYQASTGRLLRSLPLPQ